MKKSNRTTYLGLAVALATWYNQEDTTNSIKKDITLIKDNVEKDSDKLYQRQKVRKYRECPCKIELIFSNYIIYDREDKVKETAKYTSI